jgi:hypothetical protein
MAAPWDEIFRKYDRNDLSSTQLAVNFLWGPNMSWLDNFKITFKINLIVALMGLVTIGTVIYAAQRMWKMDDATPTW